MIQIYSVTTQYNVLSGPKMFETSKKIDGPARDLTNNIIDAKWLREKNSSEL